MKEKIETELINQVALEINENLRTSFVEFISMYNKGEYIYKDVIKRNLRINDEMAQYVMNLLIKNNIAKLMYRYYCPNCMRDVGLFTDINQLEEDEDIYCDECDDKIPKNSKHYFLKIL